MDNSSTEKKSNPPRGLFIIIVAISPPPHARDVNGMWPRHSHTVYINRQKTDARDLRATRGARREGRGHLVSFATIASWEERYIYILEIYIYN